jgi:hypothetical protein
MLWNGGSGGRLWMVTHGGPVDLLSSRSIVWGPARAAIADSRFRISDRRDICSVAEGSLEHGKINHKTNAINMTNENRQKSAY